MESAQNNFDIPLIVAPENLASPDLDELSGMTYLSYFMKVDSPGYFATMRYVNEMIPDQNIRNFQVGYNYSAVCTIKLLSFSIVHGHYTAYFGQ